MADVSPSEAIATVDQVERSPQGIVKRWTAELDLASEAEKSWRDKVKELWSLYESEKPTANSFNIFWSNTETLRPACYNSPPKPDVRRRFRDKDPVGKYAADVTQRSLTYLIDAYDFEHQIVQTVLDMLVAGRGVGYVKYEPTFRALAPATESADPIDEASTDEEIDGELVTCEQVQWDDFRRGPGKTWKEVPWAAIRHKMPHDQMVKMFGKDMADKVPLGEIEETTKVADKEIRTLLKVGEVWQIWDKSKRNVLFVCEAYKDQPLKECGDPLRLKAFFPFPRPLYAIENSKTLIPGPLYCKYEQQAIELNRTTMRINKIVNALKVRGAYSGALGEVAKIIQADDNEMIPIENASEIANMGGLDKAIWIMPIEKLAMVLKELYEARAATLQTIYEITGLGDIMRGVSNPHETLGAQQLKSQWGSLRLQKMQREVQRFIRDLLRLKAEVITEHFQVETLQAMTDIQLPTAEDKQKVQQLQQQAQQPGAPPPPPEAVEEGKKILTTPTWDEVMALLKSPKMLQYRIDIETDSTIQETITRDTQGMQEAITGVVNIFTGIAPAVKEGYLSVDVVKALAQSAARVSRMGTAVEDAIEQMQQPPPPPPPPPDTSIQVAQIKTGSDQKIADAKHQHEQALTAAEAQHKEQLAGIEAQRSAAEAAHKAQTDQIQLAADERVQAAQEQNKRDLAMVQEQNKRDMAAAADEAKAAREAAANQLKTDSAKEIEVLKAAVQIVTAQIGAEKKASAAGPESEAVVATEEEATFGRQALMDQLQKLIEAQTIEKEHTFNYDAEGNVIGAVSKPKKPTKTLQ